MSWNGTPDSEVERRLEAGEDVTIEVPLDDPVVRLIDLERGEESYAEFIQSAVLYWLNVLDKGVDEVEATAEVELPLDIARRVSLWSEIRSQGTTPPVSPESVLINHYCRLDIQATMDGDPIEWD